MTSPRTLAVVQSRIAVVMLLAVAAAVGGLIGIYRWWLPDVPIVMTYKRQVIERHLDAETVVLGASRSLFGVAPRLIPGEAVSLAGAAQDLYYDLALARHYLARMPRLKRVVVEVQVWSFEEGLERGSDEWRQAAYWYVFDIPPAKWRFYRFIPLAALVARGALFQAAPANPFADDGSSLQWKSIDKSNGRKAAAASVALMDPKEAPMRVADLTNLIRECQARGIEVVLVSLPCNECYRSHVDQTAFHRMQESTQQVIRETGVRYLNYYSDERFTDEHFADCHHMNGTGAEFFTRILADELGPLPESEAPARP